MTTRMQIIAGDFPRIYPCVPMGALLHGAVLYKARVFDEELATTKSLAGVSMPDGMKYDIKDRRNH